MPLTPCTIRFSNKEPFIADYVIHSAADLLKAFKAAKLAYIKQYGNKSWDFKPLDLQIKYMDNLFNIESAISLHSTPNYHALWALIKHRHAMATKIHQSYYDHETQKAKRARRNSLLCLVDTHPGNT